MSRFGLVSLVLAGCSSSADLELKLDPDTAAVGETIRVVLSGLLDAPANTDVTLTVAAQSKGGDLDVPEVTFEAISATPSGASDFLDGRDAAVNEAPGVKITLVDGAEEVTVKWDMVCGTAGDWELFGSVRMETAGGAPMSPNVNLKDQPFTCE